MFIPSLGLASCGQKWTSMCVLLCRRRSRLLWEVNAIHFRRLGCWCPLWVNRQEILENIFQFSDFHPGMEDFAFVTSFGSQGLVLREWSLRLNSDGAITQQRHKRVLEITHCSYFDAELRTVAPVRPEARLGGENLRAHAGRPFRTQSERLLVMEIEEPWGWGP